jgi:type IV secretion system protein VirB3
MIRQDPLFKGATRPAMKWGVPVVPFGVSFIAFLLLGMYASFLVGIGLTLALWVFYVPLFLIMRQMVKHDDQAFRLLFLKLKFRARTYCNGSARFWRSTPYAPVALKARK